jgi:predicted transcriptional regulator
MYNPVSHNEFKKAVANNKGVQSKITEIEQEFAIYKKLLAARTEAGLSQTDVAKLMHTTPSVVSRLESIDDKRSPSIRTLKKYAEAIGCKLNISFEPVLQ